MWGMPRCDRGRLDCPQLAEYFRLAFKPRAEWMVGIELETMGQSARTRRPLAYEGGPPDVHAVLEAYLAARGGEFIHEGDKPIGIDGPWGGISLEPGGQVEWSSKPARDLDALDRDLRAHASALASIAERLGVRWLDVAVQPELPVDEMPWMPKARYGIMRTIMAQRGRLAHRMMTQTASIQCAFDYASDADWARKFRAAALLTPVAVALFANSSRVDGADTGWASYRQAIWRETDPERCDLPPVVFDPQFGIDAWVDWVCEVPTLFLRRGSGLVPSPRASFRTLLDRQGCDGVTMEDWELHLSSIFTEVRSYTYVEVRSADLQPLDLALAVPALWTGLLYDEAALDDALRIGRPFDDHGAWRRAMDTAARRGLAGTSDGISLADKAAQMVARAGEGLRAGAACAGTSAGGDALERLARARSLAAGAR